LYQSLSPVYDQIQDVAALFEPGIGDRDWVSTCLKEIAVAFNKPAIISSHRVNFVGGMSMDNRDDGLQKLQTLLNKIVSN